MLRLSALHLFIMGLFFGACSADKQHFSKPSSFIVIAHRGASGYLPEHTLQSASYAHALGADYLEVDVVLTRDDQLIVLHDLTLESTTNVANLFAHKRRDDGRYYAIDFHLDQIKKLSIKNRTNNNAKPKYPSRYNVNENISFKIPTLKEYIHHLQSLNNSTSTNTGLYLEIKDEKFHQKHNKDIVKLVHQTISQMGLNTEESRVYYQSFEPWVLKRLTQEFKSPIKKILLLADNAWMPGAIDYSKLYTNEGIEQHLAYIDGLGPWIHHLITSPKKSAFTKKMSRQGMQIHPYTHRHDDLPQGFSSTALLNFLQSKAGASGVFSDFPDIAKQWVKNR